MAGTTENILLNILVFTAKDKGPFRGLSQSVQRLAIELLFHLASIDTKLLQVLVSCCQDEAGVNISVIEYIVQVLYYRCDMEKKKKQLVIFQRFLLSVLVNNNTANLFDRPVHVLSLYRSPCYQGHLSYPVAFSLPLFLGALFSIAIGKSVSKV